VRARPTAVGLRRLTRPRLSSRRRRCPG